MSERVPEGWEIRPLSALADYHNGRAFKPEDWSKQGLPIVRIAQINNPFRETDHYSGSDVLDRHLIRKGDLVFSWSATLKAILWNEYDAILNQHIFKVTSNEYPKFFYFFELNRYLNHFKMMAENRKTTMGHITQEHLQQSKILTPSKDLIDKLDVIIDPLLEKIIHCEKENTTLLNLRNWLMPFLINGHAIKT